MASQGLIDTTAVFALQAAGDQWNAQAMAHARATTTRTYHSTSSVVEETFTLMRRRLGFERAIRAVDGLRASSRIIIHETDASRTWALLRELRYVPLSFTDASLIVLARRLRITEVFTFDSDFAAAGLTVVP